MEKSSVGKGLGCASMVPAAFIGFAGLTDGIGPTGWRGFAEIFGWIAVCVAASYCLATLFTPVGWARGWRFLFGILALSGFTYATNWLGLGAPMAVKVLFTSVLQVIGVIAVVGLIASIVYFARSGRQKL
jgi:hypothetical protein